MPVKIFKPEPSLVPTPWAVRCSESCGRRVYLTNGEYINQLDNPQAYWRCPVCLVRAEWDDDNYEEWMDIGEAIHFGTWLSEEVRRA